MRESEGEIANYEKVRGDDGELERTRESSESKQVGDELETKSAVTSEKRGEVGARKLQQTVTPKQCS